MVCPEKTKIGLLPGSLPNFLPSSIFLNLLWKACCTRTYKCQLCPVLYSRPSSTLEAPGGWPEWGFLDLGLDLTNGRAEWIRRQEWVRAPLQVSGWVVLVANRPLSYQRPSPSPCPSSFSAVLLTVRFCTFSCDSSIPCPHHYKGYLCVCVFLVIV